MAIIRRQEEKIADHDIDHSLVDLHWDHRLGLMVLLRGCKINHLVTKVTAGTRYAGGVVC